SSGGGGSGGRVTGATPAVYELAAAKTTALLSDSTTAASCDGASELPAMSSIAIRQMVLPRANADGSPVIVSLEQFTDQDGELQLGIQMQSVMYIQMQFVSTQTLRDL